MSVKRSLKIRYRVERKPDGRWWAGATDKQSVYALVDCNTWDVAVLVAVAMARKYGSDGPISTRGLKELLITLEGEYGESSTSKTP